MVREKVSFVFKKRKFSVEARTCGFFSFGLMFRTRQTEPCVFRFDNDTNFRISSLFVPFSFLAIWLDGKNRVMSVRKVNPFTVSVSSDKPYRTLLEIPVNKKYSKLVNIFGRGLFRR
ncbi:MAG: DUF192 domain-containing protein [Nanoarchaeota archaeon]|nr:DUF192 domain-containing protein [Nanoarchaeota archaeon]MBU1501318.1 DUF192 domain-containing protein [Nanoarchaeota archaeon]MBU2459429.1 DUF192 domain-containing protein [Nanoarchaeota archaeon]